jgi:hypothetical protein
MSDRCYSDADGIKASIAQILSKFELTRPQMIKCLDLALDMPLDNLEKLFNGFSVNQKKSKFGLAINRVIEFKKEHHL